MGFGYNVEEEFTRVRRKNDSEYNSYIDEAKKLNNEYVTSRDKYNGEIAIINSTRAGMRDEIDKLYDYLKNIGGSIGEKLTVFDYISEAGRI